MPKIEELLSRRTDLSTFLVHLSRDTSDGMSAREHLICILTEWTLRRGDPLGVAAALAKRHKRDHPELLESQRVICFTETPLEHAWMMCEDIDNRQKRFKPYGLVFTKTWARLSGVNPVWYVDITPNGHDWLINAVDVVRDAAVSACEFDHDIFRLTPYIETMGRMSESAGRRPKEFWWEREWRYAGGDLTFVADEVVAVLVPEDDHCQFACDLRARQQGASGTCHDLRYLDPRWSLQRMIVALAGVHSEFAEPFPPYPPPRVGASTARRSTCQAAVRL